MSGDHVIKIKKYPNRRYYDASRSCNVTLDGIFELVRSGRDVQIADSRSGSDLTNKVLVQILLDRDTPKLDLVPSTFLHLMIRANLPALRAWIQRSCEPMLDMLTTAQPQFDAYLRRRAEAPASSPIDAGSRMGEAFSPGASSPEAEAEPTPRSDPIDELRLQMQALTRQMQNLNGKRKPTGST